MSKAAEQVTEVARAPGPAWVRVGRSQDLSGEGPYVIAAGGLVAAGAMDLVFLRTKTGPRVFQGRCPHQGALLGEGELDGATLVCRNHRWRFDGDSGRREGGTQCLVACPVIETAGEILVDPTPLAAADVAARASAASVARAGLRRPADLPGPPGLPLAGNLLDLDLPRLHQVLEGWAAEYGTLYAFRMGSKPVVVTSDPALAEPILRARPEAYRRVGNLERIFEELGVDGVFSAEGAAWRPQRRLTMEALANRHLAGFYPTLRLVAERLRKRWLGAADRGETLDVPEELKRFTVDVTTALTFGHDINTIEQTGDDVIQRRLELLFPTFSQRLFAALPWWRFVRTPADRRVDRAVADLRVWLEGLVREARARLDADPSRAARPSNFLEAMIATRDDAGQPFSDRVIFGNLMTMLLAGEDTTAYTLAWAVHHLCETPAAVGALQAELDGVLGAQPLPADIEGANRLAFAGGVANEAMRLRPVAPVVILEAIVPTTVGDVALPPGGQVALLTRPAAIAAKNFHAPGSFRPERWLGDVGAPGGAHNPSAHVPFGSGPRICPGRSLALLEMKVVLALIYKTFTVTRVGPAAGVREAFAFTMSPRGLTARLARRAPRV